MVWWNTERDPGDTPGRRKESRSHNGSFFYSHPRRRSLKVKNPHLLNGKIVEKMNSLSSDREGCLPLSFEIRLPKRVYRYRKKKRGQYMN